MKKHYVAFGLIIVVGVAMIGVAQTRAFPGLLGFDLGAIISIFRRIDSMLVRPNPNPIVQDQAPTSSSASIGSMRAITTSTGVARPIRIHLTSAAPHINSLSASQGPIGTRVIITGTNFSSSTTIRFGSGITLSRTVPSTSTTTVEFLVPSGIAQLPYPPGTSACPKLSLVTAGAYSVSVSNANGNSNALQFTVTPASVSEITKELSSSAKGNAGSDPVNKSKNAMVCVTTAEQFEALTDSYFSNPLPSKGQWDGLSWGRQWLSEYGVYIYGVKGWEIRNLLNARQKDKMKLILADGTKESNMQYDKCGKEIANSCSEDYTGFVMAISAAKLNGVSGLDQIERQYVEKSFSVSNSSTSYGLTREQQSWDPAPATKMYNHGGENPVYAGILLINMNDAAYTYRLRGAPVPSYYAQSSMKDLFSWIQTKAQPDGSAYKQGQCHNPAGGIFPCEDNFAKATPFLIPGGRFMRSIFGSGAFTPGAFTFETFKELYLPGGNFDAGRRYMYDIYNH